MSVYSSVSPALGLPGCVRSATVFCRAVVLAVSVCFESGSVGLLVTVCSSGKFGFALVHFPSADDVLTATAVPPVPSGITSAFEASFSGTK